MSDVIPTELKIVVERVVRPLHVSITRKRRMREELLDHLLPASEEEFERLGEKKAALDRAIERFGDQGEVSSDLQKAEPCSSRLVYLNEKLRYERDETLLHFGAKILLFTLAGYVVAILPFLPRLLHVWGPAGIGAALYSLFVIAMASAAFTFAFVFFAE